MSRDPLDHPVQAPIDHRPGATAAGRPDPRRDALERLTGEAEDAHERQRALVRASLLLAPGRDLPTHRRWA